MKICRCIKGSYLSLFPPHSSSHPFIIIIILLLTVWVDAGVELDRTWRRSEVRFFYVQKPPHMINMMKYSLSSLNGRLPLLVKHLMILKRSLLFLSRVVWYSCNIFHIFLIFVAGNAQFSWRVLGFCHMTAGSAVLSADVSVTLSISLILQVHV